MSPLGPWGWRSHDVFSVGPLGGMWPQHSPVYSQILDTGGCPRPYPATLSLLFL